MQRTFAKRAGERQTERKRERHRQSEKERDRERYIVHKGGVGEIVQKRRGNRLVSIERSEERVSMRGVQRRKERETRMLPCAEESERERNENREGRERLRKNC